MNNKDLGLEKDNGKFVICEGKHQFWRRFVCFFKSSWYFVRHDWNTWKQLAKYGMLLLLVSTGFTQERGEFWIETFKPGSSSLVDVNQNTLVFLDTLAADSSITIWYLGASDSMDWYMNGKKVNFEIGEAWNDAKRLSRARTVAALYKSNRIGVTYHSKRGVLVQWERIPKLVEGPTDDYETNGVYTKIDTAYLSWLPFRIPDHFVIVSISLIDPLLKNDEGYDLKEEVIGYEVGLFANVANNIYFGVGAAHRWDKWDPDAAMEEWRTTFFVSGAIKAGKVMLFISPGLAWNYFRHDGLDHARVRGAFSGKIAYRTKAMKDLDVLASFGGDWMAVNEFNVQDTNLNFGVGIGYRISN